MKNLLRPDIYIFPLFVVAELWFKRSMLEWFRTLTLSKPQNLQVFCSLKYSYANTIWIGTLPAERPVLIPGTFDMISISRAVVSTVTELHTEHKVQQNVNLITEGTNICACTTHTVYDSNWHVWFSFVSTCLLQGVMPRRSTVVIFTVPGM